MSSWGLMFWLIQMTIMPIIVLIDQLGMCIPWVDQDGEKSLESSNQLAE